MKLMGDIGSTQHSWARTMKATKVQEMNETILLLWSLRKRGLEEHSGNTERAWSRTERWPCVCFWLVWEVPFRGAGSTFSTTSGFSGTFFFETALKNFEECIFIICVLNVKQMIFFNCKNQSQVSLRTRKH